MTNTKDLLLSIAEMRDAAPVVGLCSYPFQVLYERVETLANERDNLMKKTKGVSE
jgi:hypothetical protein